MLNLIVFKKWISRAVGPQWDAAELGPDGQPSQGYFQFTRTGNLNQPLTVNYTVGDSGPTSATPGYEYKTLGGSVTFNAGIASVLVAVLPKEINLVEGTTSVLVNVVSSSTYTTDAYGGSATVNIVNTDDATITITPKPIPVGTQVPAIVKVVDHYHRPLHTSLQIGNDSPAVLTPTSPTAMTGTDGAAVVSMFGVTIGAAVITAATPAGSSGQADVKVVNNGIDVIKLEYLNEEDLLQDSTPTKGVFGTPYDRKQWWLGPNLQAGATSALAPVQDFPIAYVVSTEKNPSVAKVIVTVLANAGVNPTDGWMLKGLGETGDDDTVTFAPSAITRVGRDLRSTLTESDTLPTTIESSDLIVDWQISYDSGHTWTSIRTTTNHLYMTGARIVHDAPPANGGGNGDNYETVVAIGCIQANGDTPSQANGNAILGQIFTYFHGLSVKHIVAGKEVGNAMTYWGGAAGNGPSGPTKTDSDEFFHVEGLLGNSDGRCGAWSSLFRAVAAAQGLAVKIVGITPKPTIGNFMQVHPGPAQGEATAPITAFINHAVDLWTEGSAGSYKFHLFDPSYGYDTSYGYNEQSTAATLGVYNLSVGIAWEIHALVGISKTETSVTKPLPLDRTATQSMAVNLNK